MSITFPHIFIFLSIIITIFLFRENKPYIFGVVLISVSLLFLDLPDIDEYRTHYDLTGTHGFDYVTSLYNFEPGYVFFVIIMSSIFTFEVFYIVTISLAIHAYLNFFRDSGEGRHYVYAAFFLPICLYFIAFTLRTTLASIFLVYAIMCLKRNRNVAATALIIVGAMFHIVIAPMIILPVVKRFSVIIAKYYIFIFILLGALSIIAAQGLSLTSLVGVNDIIDLKISSYDDANIKSNSFYFVLWIVALILSLVPLKSFSDFDRVLSVSLVIIILLLYPFQFIQGRFMWLTSFLFAYFFTKSTLMRFNFGETGRVVLVCLLPLAVFSRI